MPPVQISDSPLFGLWQAGQTVHKLYYGAGCVAKHLLSSLPSTHSRIFVVTSKTVAWETPLVEDLRQLLGDQIVGIYAQVQQDVPIDGVFDAIEMMGHIEEKVDTIIAVGGGSAMDFAKILSVQARANAMLGPFKTIAIPTTLSAAECTIMACYTKNGTKMTIHKPLMAVSAIFYDPEYGQYTPKEIWLATGITALDHAVETMYHPHATEFPTKATAIWAAQGLFEGLKEISSSWPGTRDQMTRLFLAAHASNSMKSPKMYEHKGLSHLFGFALGTPHKIQSAQTSCITLGKVIIFTAKSNASNAKQIARLLPMTGIKSTGKEVVDACQVGHSIITLVKQLGFDGNLSHHGVQQKQLMPIAFRVGGARGLRPEECQPIINLVKTFFDEPRPTRETSHTLH